LLELMRQLARSGMTLLVSGHDWGPALDDYDRVVVLDGRVLADGPPRAVRHTLGNMAMGNHRCG
jgi:zinc/manganese transport system ATP-binding protein